MGLILGDPGGSLDATGFAAAAVGAAGEVRTAGVLNLLAAGTEVAVLHDLDVPRPGWRANLDHVAVSGARVLIVDSKVWRPGVYWTAGGVTRRGLARFEPAERRGMVAARAAVGGFLAARGLEAQVVVPLLVVWTSGPGRFVSLLLEVPGARTLPGPRFERVCGRVVGAEDADRDVVAALADLVR